MSQREEEFQRKIEQGREVEGDPLDVQAYREVFARLKRQPQIRLSEDFADRIVVQVLERRKRRAVRDYFWLGTGIFFLTIAFGVAVFITGFKAYFGFLTDISAYAGIFAFGAVFIMILNRLDKKLLTDKNKAE